MKRDELWGKHNTLIRASRSNYDLSGDQENPMKVLFVCYANVGRSQVAEACFKTLSQHESDSAGIAVNERIATTKVPSRKLKDNLNQRSVEYVRREFGLDIAEKER